MTEETQHLSAGDALTEALEPVKDAPITMSAATSIATMALSLALKYHDVAIVKDGAMYNAYKLEGRNMAPISEEWVLQTAMRFEKFILGANTRLTEEIIEGVIDAIEGELADDGESPVGAPE